MEGEEEGGCGLVTLRLAPVDLARDRVRVRDRVRARARVRARDRVRARVRLTLTRRTLTLALTRWAPSSAPRAPGAATPC